MCFLPPNLTEAIQPIDAGYGRSMRSCIDSLLDDWLMVDKNLDKWEAGMTAGERRLLISNFVDRANQITLKRDKMRVGCFIRTGCLMTLDGSDDDKIQPQALTKKIIIDTRCLSSQEVIDNFGGLTMDEVSNETIEIGLTREELEIHLTLPEEEMNEDNEIIIDEELVEDIDSGNDTENENEQNECIDMLQDLVPPPPQQPPQPPQPPRPPRQPRQPPLSPPSSSPSPPSLPSSPSPSSPPPSHQQHQRPHRDDTWRNVQFD